MKKLNIASILLAGILFGISGAACAKDHEIIVLQGSARNQTVGKTDKVAIVLANQEGGAMRASGTFGGKDLFGDFEAKGKKTPCPSGARDDSALCVAFDGILKLGEDGSGFRPGTRTDFRFVLVVTEGKATGYYRVGAMGDQFPVEQTGRLGFPEGLTLSSKRKATTRPDASADDEEQVAKKPEPTRRIPNGPRIAI